MSRELDAFREAVRGFVNRSNGMPTEGEVSTISSVSIDEAMRNGRLYFHTEADPNNPGKRRAWNPQNEDGTFKYLPGLDGPVST